MALNEEVKIELAFQANLDAYEKEIRKLPDMSEKQVKAAVRAMGKQWRTAERDAKKTADGAKGAWTRSLKSIGEAGDRISSELGGTFGDIGGAMSSLIEAGSGVGATLGPVGAIAAVSAAALGGLTLASGFAASAMLDFGRSAVEASERLGPASALSGEMAERMDRLGSSMASTDEALSGASATIASALEPELSALADTVTGLALVTRLAAEGFAAFEEATGFSLGGAASDVQKLGERYSDAMEAVREMEAEIKRQVAEVEKQIKATEEAARVNKNYTKSIRDQEKALGDQFVVMQQAAAVQAAYTEGQFLGMQEQSTLRQQVELTDIAMSDYSASIDAANSVGISYTDGVRAASGALDELQAKLDLATTVVTSLGGSFATFASLRSDALAEEADTIAEQSARRIQLIRSETRTRLDGLLESGQITAEQHATEIKNTNAVLRAKEKADGALLKQKRQAAKKAHSATQAAQISLATIEAARATLALTPFFWFLGPGAPAAAAGVTGVALTAQIGVIKSQPAPSFPGGGLVGSRMAESPDHVSISARPDEGIVSPQGMAAIGGEAALSAINRGAPSGGGAPVLMLNGRMVSGLLSQSVRDPRLAATLESMAGRVPGQLPLVGG